MIEKCFLFIVCVQAYHSVLSYLVQFGTGSGGKILNPFSNAKPCSLAY